MSVRFLEQDVEYVTFMGELLERFRFKGARVWTRPRSGSLLYITLTSELTVKLYFTQSVANGISIDWGDGTEPETVNNTSANPSHTYDVAGDYVVSLTAVDDATWSPGGLLYNILTREGGGKGNTSPELTQTVLDNSVSGLNSYAFDGCTSLTEIALSPSVAEIGSYAFYGCTSLKEINVPDGVTAISTYAFYGCTNLERVILPESVTTIGTYAFYDCTALKEIVFPPALASIGNYAFFGCISLPANLELAATTLDHSAFAKCTQLEKVWLRAAITTINAYEAKKDGAVTARYGPFLNCDASLVLYCEPASRPEGWNQYFNVYTGLDTRLSTQYGVTDRPW